MTTAWFLQEEKIPKEVFRNLRNMWWMTISSNTERPWRPDSLLSYFKVCFSFSSCLDSIKPLGKEETAWRSCTTIYSHPQNNICPFNEYNKPSERIINGKFWSRIEWFLKISQSAVNSAGLAGSWLDLHIWFSILFLPNGILGTLWNWLLRQAVFPF